MAPQHTPSDLTVTRRGALGLVGGLALAASGCLLAGCAAGEGARQQAPAPAAGAAGAADAFTMALQVDLDGLDPQRTAAAATFEITNNVYDPLVRVDLENAIVPGLAESWEVSEDACQVTFHLRPGAVFSNGNPCDAAAVVASFERLQSDESPRVSEYAGYAFEAADEATVVVTSAEPNAAMLTDFAYAWAAVVDVSAADTLAGKPVGTGPYVVEEWVPQQSLTLTANPTYWGAAPKTPTVVLRILPDATSQLSSLRAGDIDLMQVQVYAQADQLAGDAAFQVLDFPMNGVQLMAMNCANEALADVRVRQAINMAVDKDALIDAVWWGHGEKIGSHYPPVLEGYVDCTGAYAYDPDGARELLAQAGYADGLTLRMRLPESYPVYVDAGQIIADSLARVGIACAVEIIEWSTWLAEVYGGARDYDLTVVGHTGRLDAATLLARYASDSSENYFNYANPAVDELLAHYRASLDADERRADMQEIQRILAEDVPALYIQTPVMVYLASSKVQGFAQYPVDVYEFKDVWIEG